MMQEYDELKGDERQMEAGRWTVYSGASCTWSPGSAERPKSEAQQGYSSWESPGSEALRAEAELRHQISHLKIQDPSNIAENFSDNLKFLH